MAKQKKEVTDFSDVVVTLKPLFGIKPHYYLPAMYLIIIALIVFFIFFVPGLSKHGTIITFKTIPAKAPVYVDTKYVGSTPCSVFVKSGDREIVIKKPFYREIIVQKQVKGRIFATLFSPRKETIFRQCELADLEGLLQWAIKDAAQFGMLKDFTANYQFPSLFSDAVSALYGTEENITKRVYNFLHNAMLFVDSEQELWELLNGFACAASEKKGFSAFTMINMLKEIINLEKRHDGMLAWITGSLPHSKQKEEQTSLYNGFTSSDWFINYFNAYKEKIIEIHKKETIHLDTGKNITVENLSFIYVPETTYIMGNSFHMDSMFYPDMEILPHPVKIKSCYISETEVTNSSFHGFVKANPEWLPENKEKLISEGLATEYYLSHWSGSSPLEEDMKKPVTNVSYYAAHAYCLWFSSLLSSGNASARLPHESEWEYVAKYIETRITPSVFFLERSNVLADVGTNNNDQFPVKDIFGGVWEWCDNWFYPKDSALFVPNPFSDENMPTFTGSEKVVRGGSWANTKADNIRSSTRGSQPPSWCTPYLGFRIVLSEY